MYAIVESCGKQYKVAEGDIVFFEKLDIEEGKKVTFDKVMLVSDNDKIQIGNPYVKDVEVLGKVLSHGKGKKIIVFKMKAKKNYRRKQGHRQPYTKVEIESIKTGTVKAEKAVEEKVVVTEKKPVEKKETATKTTATKATTEKKETVKKTTTATTKKAPATKKETVTK